MRKANINAMILITIVVLAFAPMSLPYGYYTFLRIITTATFGFLSYDAITKTEKPYKISILALFAVLYNPVIPIHLEKEVWSIINFLTIVILSIYYFFHYK